MDARSLVADISPLAIVQWPFVIGRNYDRPALEARRIKTAISVS
jgi:hypothetical protein